MTDRFESSGPLFQQCVNRFTNVCDGTQECDQAKATIAAIHFWERLPVWTHDADALKASQDQLEALHEQAERLLLRELERRGLDCSPVVDSGRICRLLCRAFRDANLSEEDLRRGRWPNAIRAKDDIGGTLLGLPHLEKKRVIQAERAIIRLRSKIDAELSGQDEYASGPVQRLRFTIPLKRLVTLGSDPEPAKTKRYVPPPCPKCEGSMMCMKTEKEHRRLTCRKCHHTMRVRK